MRPLFHFRRVAL